MKSLPGLYSSNLWKITRHRLLHRVIFINIEETKEPTQKIVEGNERRSLDAYFTGSFISGAVLGSTFGTITSLFTGEDKIRTMHEQGIKQISNAKNQDYEFSDALYLFGRTAGQIGLAAYSLYNLLN